MLFSFQPRDNETSVSGSLVVRALKVRTLRVVGLWNVLCDMDIVTLTEELGDVEAIMISLNGLLCIGLLEPPIIRRTFVFFVASCSSVCAPLGHRS